MTVVIVGAGIGGLVTALRLHHEGLDCEVYEQSEQIRELGVGLNALPNAVKELAVLGLLDWLEELGVRTSELFYTHRLGHEILRRPCGMQAGFSYPQLSIHRGQLQGVLLRAVRERLGPDAVRTGHRLVGFEQDARGVRADFVGRRGEALDPAHGAVLAAADGIHSTVRSLLFPEEGPPCWNGVMMWRGATDWPEFGTGRAPTAPVKPSWTPPASAATWRDMPTLPTRCRPTSTIACRPPARWCSATAMAARKA